MNTFTRIDLLEKAFVGCQFQTRVSVFCILIEAAWKLKRSNKMEDEEEVTTFGEVVETRVQPQKAEPLTTSVNITVNIPVKTPEPETVIVVEEKKSPPPDDDKKLV